MYFIQATQAYSCIQATQANSFSQAGRATLFPPFLFSRDLTHAQGTAQHVHSDSLNLPFVSHHFHVYLLSKIHSFFVLTKFIWLVMYLLLSESSRYFRILCYGRAAKLLPSDPIWTEVQQNFYELPQLEQVLSKNSSNFSRMLPNLSSSPKGYWNCYCDGN